MFIINSPLYILSFMIVKVQIPQSLTILPSDTEAQKAAKKKKLHSLQSIAKRKEEEQRGNQTQSDWLAFKRKMESKKVKRAIVRL